MFEFKLHSAPPGYIMYTDSLCCLCQGLMIESMGERKMARKDGLANTLGNQNLGSLHGMLSTGPLIPPNFLSI